MFMKGSRCIDTVCDKMREEEAIHLTGKQAGKSRCRFERNELMTLIEYEAIYGKVNKETGKHFLFIEWCGIIIKILEDSTTP